MEILLLILVIFVIIFTFIFLFTGLFGAPYVPTDSKFLKDIEKVYKMKEGDLLIDLGAGDGKILEEASKKGARALGIEINPVLVLFMTIKYAKNRKIKIKCRNFFKFSFPKETTVVYSFILGLNMKRVYRKIEDEATRLKKPIFLISNAFDVEGKKHEKHQGRFYLYRVLPRTTGKKKKV